MRAVLSVVALLWFAVAQAQTTADWKPTEQQEAGARETVARFLAAVDQGRGREAYDMLTPAMRATTRREQFESYVQELGNISGGALGRDAPRVTWYKDPPGAPLPGVYAAFKLSCAFRNLKSCDEDLMLHEQPGGVFLVIRSQRNYVR